MDNELAPIVLFVYNRPHHTDKTLQHLKANFLANESTLYIYADGPRVDCDKAKLSTIDEVRLIIKREKWCKEVIIYESNINIGLAQSIKMGVTDVLKRHDKVIVLEDDLITSPAFLSYMNCCLSHYSERNSVFSIGGYCLPPEKLTIPNDYNYDVFVSLRNTSWGWATWQNRWKQVDWNVNLFDEISNNPFIVDSLNWKGDDVFKMLQSQQNGSLNIWSIQFVVAHFVNHAISILPTKSYVDNIGMDGTGENCISTDSLKNSELNTNTNIKLLDILYQDKRIINSFYNAYCHLKRPLWQKIFNRMSRLFGGENIYNIKRKIYN